MNWSRNANAKAGNDAAGITAKYSLQCAFSVMQYPNHVTLPKRDMKLVIDNDNMDSKPVFYGIDRICL